MSIRSLAASLGGDAMTVMQTLEQLSETLLVYTPDGGMGGLGSLVPALIACVSRFMSDPAWDVPGDEEEYGVGSSSGVLDGDGEGGMGEDDSGLASIVVERAVSALVRAEDLDHGCRAALASPASLATLARLLRAAAGGAGPVEQDTAEGVVKVLCRVAASYAQSVLRSGCVLACLRLYSASGSVPGCPSMDAATRGRVLDLALAGAEAAHSREDMACMLEVCPLLVDMIRRAYPAPSSCTIASSSEGGAGGQQHQHQQQQQQQRLLVCAAPGAPSSASISQAADVALRALARLASNQAHMAQGHWAQWAREYGILRERPQAQAGAGAGAGARGSEGEGEGDEMDDSTASPSPALRRTASASSSAAAATAGANPTTTTPVPIPANWAYATLVHLVRMGVVEAWATALAGHGAAMAAAGTGPVAEGSSSSGSGSGSGSGADLSASLARLFAPGCSGFLLSRACLRALLRGLARVLLVLRTADALPPRAKAGVKPLPAGLAGQGGQSSPRRAGAGAGAGSSSSSSSSAAAVPSFSSCAASLGGQGIVISLQALLLAATAASAAAANAGSSGGAAGGAAAGSGDALPHLAPPELHMPHAADTTDGLVASDCLLLARVLLQAER